MAKLFSWGRNDYGQLGLGDTSDRHSPVQVEDLTTWKEVAAGTYRSIAIKDDGTLWKWGNGQTTPVQVGSDTDWVAIASGESHHLALKSDGSLWAWGSNSHGQLGLGDTDDRSSPTQVGTDTDWSFIACGHFHSLAIKDDGTLWVWGWNSYYCLGLGDTTERHSPTQLGSGTDWASISGGYRHTVALKSGGSLWAWGGNDHGDLGDGTTTYRTSPHHIGSLTNWSQISCGFYSTYAIKSDGTLWSWGFNDSGCLGLGDLNDRHSPTQVGSGNNWAYVTGSLYASAYGIKSNCTLWSWGNGNDGALGLGDVNIRKSPCQIGSLKKWSKISGGYSHVLALMYPYPHIYSGKVPQDNSYCKIDVTEPVYSDQDASQTINKDDFTLFLSQNGGNVTAVNIEDLYEDAALTTPLASNTGYSTFYAKLNLNGNPRGVETIEIKPASSSSVYGADGSASPDSETTGALTLNEAFQIASFDGKVHIVLSTSNPFDGKVAINNPTNFLDGKARVKDAAVKKFDGRIDVNTITDLLDGKGRIKDSATNILDGLVDIKDTATISLDGKARVRSSDIDLLDGKAHLIYKTINLLDGKIHPIYKTINVLDGKVAPTDRLGNIDAFTPLPSTVFKLGGQIINDIPCISSTFLGVFRYARMQASLFPFSFQAYTGSRIAEEVPGFIANIVGTNPKVGVINGYIEPLYGIFRVGTDIRSKVDLYGCEIYADSENVSSIGGFIPGVISLSQSDSEYVARILGSIVSPSGNFNGLIGNVGKVYGRIPYLLQVIEASPGIVTNIIGEASAIGAKIHASPSGDIIVISDIPCVKWHSLVDNGIQCVILKYHRGI